MKQLFHSKSRREGHGPLVGKQVQVGAMQVRVEALVGQGGYSDIYRVVDGSGRLYALKHLRLAGDAEHIAEVQREAKTMARLRGHPNILRLHAAAFAGPKGAETDGFLLVDHCPDTLLAAMQRAHFALDERTVVAVFSAAAAGIAHMHRQSPPLAHRDLKAENVLMVGDGTWVLCDFGSATTRAQVYSTSEEIAAEEDVIRKHTTPAYRAPEMWDLGLQRQLIDTKVDIWAMGVLLFVLAFGRLPFQGDSKLAVLNGKYAMPPGRSPALRALVQELLTVDPARRPDIEAVLRRLEPLRAAVGISPAAMPGALPAPAAAAAAAAAPAAAAAAQPAPAARANGVAAQQQPAVVVTAAPPHLHVHPAPQQPQPQQQAQAQAASPRHAQPQLRPNSGPAAPVPTIAPPPGSPMAASRLGGAPAAAAAAPAAAAAAAVRAPASSSDGGAAAARGSSAGGGAFDSQDWAGFGDSGSRAAAAATPTPMPAAASQAPPVPSRAPPPAPVPSANSGGLAHSGSGGALNAAAAAAVSSPKAQHSASSSGGGAAGAPAQYPSVNYVSTQQQPPLVQAQSHLRVHTQQQAAPTKSQQHQQQQQLQPQPQQQQQQQPAPQAPTAQWYPHAPAAAAAAAPDGGGGVAELRELMLGEMDRLRSQMRLLSDQHQASVLRVKQLESYVVGQKDAIRGLQAQVAALTDQQAATQAQLQAAQAQLAARSRGEGPGSASGVAVPQLPGRGLRPEGSRSRDGGSVSSFPVNLTPSSSPERGGGDILSAGSSAPVATGSAGGGRARALASAEGSGSFSSPARGAGGGGSGGGGGQQGQSGTPTATAVGGKFWSMYDGSA